ncbi:Uncharacterized protein LW94_14299 [Fusarium fujikuroi]|nr:Uncharacterized protein Y057_8191 [Fusarium fujikuroi]KLP21648.1 Uncharacterized protein LW94_14299 [Fusarium fujikuroi]
MDPMSELILPLPFHPGSFQRLPTPEKWEFQQISSEYLERGTSGREPEAREAQDPGQGERVSQCFRCWNPLQGTRSRNATCNNEFGRYPARTFEAHSAGVTLDLYLVACAVTVQNAKEIHAGRPCEPLKSHQRKQRNQAQCLLWLGLVFIFAVPSRLRPGQTQMACRDELELVVNDLDAAN